MLITSLTHPSVQFPLIANYSVLDAEGDFVRQLLSKKQKRKGQNEVTVMLMKTICSCKISTRVSYRSECFVYPRSSQIREVVKTTTLEQDPPNPKIDGGLCLHPPSSTSKDGVFIA